MTNGAHVIPAMLKVVSALQRRHPNYSADSLTVFLVVCFEEGFGVKKLAYLCQLSESRVSRALKTLRHSDEESAAPLIRVLEHAADRRRIKVFLSDAGVELMKEIGARPAPANRPASIKRPQRSYPSH